MEQTTENVAVPAEKPQLNDRNRSFMATQGLTPVSPFNGTGQFIVSKASGGYVVARPRKKEKGGLLIGGTVYTNATDALAAIGLVEPKTDAV